MVFLMTSSHISLKHFSELIPLFGWIYLYFQITWYNIEKTRINIIWYILLKLCDSPFWVSYTDYYDSILETEPLLVTVLRACTTKQLSQPSLQLHVFHVLPKFQPSIHKSSKQYGYSFAFYDTWWHLSSSLCCHVQKKAQNRPLQQGIPPYIVSINILYCLLWCVTLTTSLDMNIELCFVFGLP